MNGVIHMPGSYAIPTFKERYTLKTLACILNTTILLAPQAGFIWELGEDAVGHQS